MAIKLSRRNLDKLESAVARPAYDMAKLTAGIVHFGVGNFHRAHMAVYLDDLFNLGRDHDWGIIGAGVMPTDALMRAKLEAQDFLTTVVEQDVDHSAARVTAPMVGYLDPADAAATMETLADPRIRIVSLTITEGGYFLDPASGVFNANHPAIVADAANPTRPQDGVRHHPRRAEAAQGERRAAVHGDVLRQRHEQRRGHAERGRRSRGLVGPT